ncbi:MAG: hypothetical protein K2Q06_02660 [Parvularculaceae bacterium]|nr:hypothetical protein [Parvularculaceae bacterium]
MRPTLKSMLVATAISVASASGASAATATIGVSNIGAQNLFGITAQGGSTATTPSIGNYVVESFARSFVAPGRFVRPIMMFDAAAFAGLNPGALTSASLSFVLAGTFNESGDTYETQVRLFSTPGLIALDNGSVAQYAALTGDGGPNTTIAALSFGSAPGVRTVNFDAAGLAALSTIVSSGNGFIGLSIREGAYVENGSSSTGTGSALAGLDGLIITPASVSLTINGAAAQQVVPVPAARPLFAGALAGAAAIGRRRKRA